MRSDLADGLHGSQYVGWFENPALRDLVRLLVRLLLRQRFEIGEKRA